MDVRYYTYITNKLSKILFIKFSFVAPTTIYTKKTTLIFILKNIVQNKSTYIDASIFRILSNNK